MRYWVKLANGGVRSAKAIASAKNGNMRPSKSQKEARMGGTCKSKCDLGSMSLPRNLFAATCGRGPSHTPPAVPSRSLRKDKPQNSHHQSQEVEMDCHNGDTLPLRLLSLAEAKPRLGRHWGMRRQEYVGVKASCWDASSSALA